MSELLEVWLDFTLFFAPLVTLSAMRDYRTTRRLPKRRIAVLRPASTLSEPFQAIVRASIQAQV